MHKPVIIVSAWNRPASLQRLLDSLERMKMPGWPVKLIISIDGSGPEKVREVAEKWSCPNIEKEIIFHDRNLGLKEHIFFCAGLTEKHESIIVLEDDLFVSPYFYEYAVAALNFYATDETIAGISLYNYTMSESCFRPFIPVDDGSDVYFMQVASSWGQAWTKAQWTRFREWFSAHADLPDTLTIPEYIKVWGPHSWKKHFIHYLSETNRYISFPRLSLSTNFEEPGVHASTQGLFQVPVQNTEKEYKLSSLRESGSIYDAWFEINPECLNRYVPELSGYNYTVDLCGTKQIDRAIPYMLTAKKGSDPLFSFDDKLQPSVQNIISRVKGNKIGLYPSAKVKESGISVPENSWTIDLIIPVGEKVDDLQLVATMESLHLSPEYRLRCIWISEVKNHTALRDLILEKDWESMPIRIVPDFSPADIQGDVFTYVLPGTLFEPDAFRYVSSIFSDHRQIDWIAFAESHDETIQLRTNARLTYRAMEKPVPSLQQMFFRNGMKNLFSGFLIGKQDSVREAGLLISLLEKYKLFAVQKSAYKGKNMHFISLHAMQINGADFPQPVAGYRVMAVMRLLVPLFRAAYKGQWLYLRSVYPLLFELPDVLRYDEKNDNFYLSRN